MSERKYINVAGVYENEYGQSFKMTEQIKQKFAEVPIGAYLNISPNKFKTESKHPDYQISYKIP